MKKTICLLLALILCMSMSLTVAAAEGDFVPSIPYKDSPDFDDATMADEDVGDCIVITSISEAKDKSTDITQEERDLLLEVYEDLDSGEEKLPIDEDYVIRDLVDVSFMYENCRMIEEHDRKDLKLKEEGVTLTIDFDLGVGAHVDVIVMAYIDGKWVPIESVTNNGDGTVTCVFEDICPVAFAVKQSQYEDVPQTGDAIGQNLGMWVCLFAVSVVALVSAVVIYSKNRKHA